MMKNQVLVGAVIAILAGGLGFLGGLSYQKSKDSLASVTPQQLPAKLQSLGLSGAGGGQGGGLGFGGRGGRRNGGGIVNGQIISKDDQSITVKLSDGSTKIVYISAKTSVTATTTASLSDLAVGKQVVANGPANADGSVAAASVQIRPLSSSPSQVQ